MIRVNGKDRALAELTNVDALTLGINDITIDVDSIGKTVNAKIFYGGEKQCTEIEFDGGSFEGANHPIMILNTDGNLEWRLIENVTVGDTILKLREVAL